MPARGQVVRYGPTDFELPEFYMPFEPRTNPHLEGVRGHTKDWAGQTGMLDGGIWDEAGFDAADYGLFAASAYPDAAPAELELVSDWHVWGWFLDDTVAVRFEPTADLAGASAFVARLRRLVRRDSPPVPDPADPTERGLADLWSRSAAAMPAGLRSRFGGQLEQFCDHRLWEIATLARGRPADPVDHLENRRKLAGFCATLARYAVGEQIPDDLVDAAPMRALAATFADVGRLRNDIVSYPKEIVTEGGINNGVLIVQRFAGCDPRRAVELVNDLATSRLRRFQELVATELPALCEDVDPRLRHKPGRYAAALRDWLAGDLHWARRTGRYRSPEPGRTRPPARRLRGPTGLGSSAARIPIPAGD